MCILCEVMKKIDSDQARGALSPGSTLACEPFTFAVVQSVVRNAIENSTMYSGHGSIISMEMFTYKGVDIVAATENEGGWHPPRTSADIINLEELMASQKPENGNSVNSLPSTANQPAINDKSTRSSPFASFVAQLAIILVMIIGCSVAAKAVLWAIGR